MNIIHNIIEKISSLHNKTDASDVSENLIKSNVTFPPSPSLSSLPFLPIPITCFTLLMIVECFIFLASLRKTIKIRVVFDKVEKRMKERITSIHERGDVFTMLRKCTLCVVFLPSSSPLQNYLLHSLSSLLPSSFNINSLIKKIKMSNTVNFYQWLDEMSESVPLHSMNICYSSTLKT